MRRFQVSLSMHRNSIQNAFCQNKSTKISEVWIQISGMASYYSTVMIMAMAMMMMVRKKCIEFRFAHVHQNIAMSQSVRSCEHFSCPSKMSNATKPSAPFNYLRVYITKMALVRLQMRGKFLLLHVFSNPHMLKRRKKLFFTTRKAPAFQINTFEGFSLLLLMLLMPRKLKWKLYNFYYLISF